MLSKILNIVLRLTEIIVLLLIVIILIFQNFITSIITLEINLVLVILVGVICLLIIHNSIFKNELIKKFENTKKEMCKFFIDDTTGAYMYLFSKVNHIKKLRIYAPTTAVIQPHFLANKNLKVYECIILLKKLRPSDKLYSKTLDKEVEVLISRWKMMVADERITKLTIIKNKTYKCLNNIGILSSILSKNNFSKTKMNPK